MSGPEPEDENDDSVSSVKKEVEALRQEIDELKEMVMLVAGKTAMIEGQQNVSHTYLRRALKELEGITKNRLMQEYIQNEVLASEMESGFELMSGEAQERGLQDLVEYLEE